MADTVRVDPATGAKTWQSQFGAAGAKYTQGINNVKTAPGAKAAAALPRWVASVTSTDVQQKFASRVSSVTLQAWQAAATGIGVQRLSQGATKGVNKYQSFATQFYPYLSTGLAQIQAMPNVTLEDRIARANALMRYNAQFKRS